MQSLQRMSANRSAPGLTRRLQVWWALRSQKRRRDAGTEVVEPPLPQVVHHPRGGFPGSPLYDDIYLAENPGALISDNVEVWVLDPNHVTILGYPNPTEADWQAAMVQLLSYNAVGGSWRYDDPGVGETKTDGDSAWIRARFLREGVVPGPWSPVDASSGAGVAVWSYG